METFINFFFGMLAGFIAAGFLGWWFSTHK